MLQYKSEEFRAFFLLQFTKELIKHSGASEVFELKNVLKEKADEEKKDVEKEKKRMQYMVKGKGEKIKDVIKKRESLTKKDLFEEFKEPMEIPLKKKLFRPLPRPPIQRILRIPEPKLPQGLQYRPVPTNVQIDLGKLNPLVNDSNIKIIECDGPNKNIMVRGTMGRKKTSIVLNKQEVDKIITEFSKTAKIPVQEGFFKVVVGKLILSSIISDVVGSKFIIKKIMMRPQIFQ